MLIFIILVAIIGILTMFCINSIELTELTFLYFKWDENYYFGRHFLIYTGYCFLQILIWIGTLYLTTN
jgi:hypothetical protein